MDALRGAEIMSKQPRPSFQPSGPGFARGRESRNPVRRSDSMITLAWGYWVPA